MCCINVRMYRQEKINSLISPLSFKYFKYFCSSYYCCITNHAKLRAYNFIKITTIVVTDFVGQKFSLNPGQTAYISFNRCGVLAGEIQRLR